MDANMMRVTEALAAVMMAAATNDKAMAKTARSYLDDPETRDALQAAGMVTVSPEGELDITDAGYARIQEMQGQLLSALGMAESAIRREEDLTGRPALKVELQFRFMELTCRRTLVVPAHITYEDFHTMIQAAMGWMNYHVYDFSMQVGGKNKTVSWPDFETGGNPDLLDFMPEDQDVEVEWVCSDNVYLDELVPDDNIMLYCYDYGDGWEIVIQIVGTQEMEGPYPVCLDGVGDAPPEDVGGEWGFEDFLRIIADEDDPERDDMLEWGLSQGFEHFDLDNTNRRLASWRIFERQDAHLMSEEAQVRAFGEVRYGAGRRASTQEILDEFERSLVASGISVKTRERHLRNAEVFLEEFLEQRRSDPLDQPAELVRAFVEDWSLSRLHMNSASAMKLMVTSIKKLYRTMVDMDLMDMDDWRALNAYLGSKSPGWVQSRSQARAYWGRA